MTLLRPSAGERRRASESGEITHVLEAGALVILQQTVLATEVPLAEAAVADDALCGLTAGRCRAAKLLSSHDEKWWETKGGVRVGGRHKMGVRSERRSTVDS
jgi:hypothetical protein